MWHTFVNTVFYTSQSMLKMGDVLSAVYWKWARCYPDNSKLMVSGKLRPGKFPPMIFNIPTYAFFLFFLFINVNRYHCCWLSLIIGNYYNIPVGSNVFIFEASHEECYITQFNQLNLNSCFSILLLITWLVCWFIWKQLLRVGLLYNIKVIENTAKQ